MSYISGQDDSDVMKSLLFAEGMFLLQRKRLLMFWKQIYFGSVIHSEFLSGSMLVINLNYVGTYLT